MTLGPALVAKATELRDAFDQERAAPVAVRADGQLENLLAVRVSKDGYAIRVGEISGLVANRKIVELPSAVPGLLGVAGVRGVLVPAFSLAVLLGYSVESDEARWLALCGTEDCVALAFSGFEGYLRIPQAQVFRAQQSDMARTHVTHVARVPNMIRAVVSIPLVRATIQERCQGSSSKER